MIKMILLFGFKFMLNNVTTRCGIVALGGPAQAAVRCSLEWVLCMTCAQRVCASLRAVCMVLPDLPAAVGWVFARCKLLGLPLGHSCWNFLECC